VVERFEAGGESPNRTWVLALILSALVVGVQTGVAPLADPDLPSHLSIGEWMVAHRAVPLVEPFAWTRAGAPYYAYSWIPQLLFFSLLKAGGPVALHLLAGFVGAAIVLASVAAARALGLRASGALLFGVFSAAVALQTTPFLRPQLFMHAIVPLAWLCSALSRDERIARWKAFVALLVLSALAASVHISFPIMAAPLAAFLAREDGIRFRPFTLACAATVFGWLLSPYGGRWIAVFSVNFASNALTKYPAPAGELAPGFIISPWLGLALAALPLIVALEMEGQRKRLVYGALWLVGLVAFARTFKALGPWWWCATPMVVAALARLPRASSQGVRRTMATLVVLGTVALALPNIRLAAATRMFESDGLHERLPSLKGYASEPAASWLERHMRRGASGKLLTSFRYGSYLKWRVPSLSQSIDGRTIFPDSAALPDAVAERGVKHLGPWRSADVAVMPLSFPVAASLDADAAWCRVGAANPAPWDSSAPRAALWVRREWWASARAASDRSPCLPTTRGR
jgi:hypothetical protein